MQNIDNIILFVLFLLLLFSISAPSEVLGLFALLFSGLCIFKNVFELPSENSSAFIKTALKKYDKALIIYFLIVTVSLFSSSLFSLSLHGYLKTCTYILFYFCAAWFFDNFSKKMKSASCLKPGHGERLGGVNFLILLIFLFISGLMTYEAIIAIIQNFCGIEEISGWQDVSNINPEQIISRAYGTLKPYNPNLLAGYLLAGLSSIVYLILYFLNISKKRIALFFCACLVLCLIAIIDTGCRGAYLGLFAFFGALTIFLLIHIYKNLGGLKNIKKRYKNLFLGGFLGIVLFIVTNPALIKRFQTILAFRQDSSISFRMNVYEACYKMFLDNPFLGIGCGNQNFREIYGLYMKTGYDALGSYCVPLEIMVENGIFALIAFIVFLYFILKKCFKICLNNKINNKTQDVSNQSRKIFALCLVLFIISLMGHGVFDTIWFRPQLQFLFWLNIALLKITENY